MSQHKLDCKLHNIVLWMAILCVYILTQAHSCIYSDTHISCVEGCMGIREQFPEYDLLERNVAQELRKQRRLREISIKDMAERLGMHPNTLGKYEKPEFNLGLELLYGYARVCDCPINAFLDSSSAIPSAHLSESPLSELNVDDALRYTALMHKLYAVLSEEKVTLPRDALLELSRMMAGAIKG